MLWWFACNIPDSGTSEYSTTDTSNSGAGKYHVAIKNKINLNQYFFIPDYSVSE